MFLAFSPSLTFHIVQLDAVDQGQFLDVCQFFRSSACRSPEIMLLLEMVSSIMLQLEVNAEVGEFRLDSKYTSSQTGLAPHLCSGPSPLFFPRQNR